MRKFILLLSILFLGNYIRGQEAKNIFNEAEYIKNIGFENINQHPTLIQLVRKQGDSKTYLQLLEYNPQNDSFNLLSEDVESDHFVLDMQTINYKDSILILVSSQISCDVIRPAKLSVFDGRNIRQYNIEEINYIREIIILNITPSEVHFIGLGSGIDYYTINTAKNTLTKVKSDPNDSGLERTTQFFKLDKYIYCLKNSKPVGFINEDFSDVVIAANITLDYLTHIKRNGEDYIVGYNEKNIYILNTELELTETIPVDFKIKKQSKTNGNIVFFNVQDEHIKGVFINESIQLIDQIVNNGLEIEGIYSDTNRLMAYGFQYYNQQNYHRGSPRIPIYFSLTNYTPISNQYDIGISEFKYDSVKVIRNCGGSPASGFSLILHNANFNITNHGTHNLSAFDLRLNYSSDGHCPKPLYFKQSFNINLLPGESSRINIGELELSCTRAFQDRDLCFNVLHDDGKYLDPDISNNSICTRITIPPPGVGTKNTIKKSIQISPNPASDFFIIKSVSLSNASYQIIDITGQLVQEGFIKEDEQKVNLLKIKSGIYFIKVSHNGHSISKKLVLN